MLHVYTFSWQYLDFSPQGRDGESGWANREVSNCNRIVSGECLPLRSCEPQGGVSPSFVGLNMTMFGRDGSWAATCSRVSVFMCLCWPRIDTFRGCVSY